MSKPIERREDWYQSVELPDKIIEACGVGSRSMAEMDRRWKIVTDRVDLKGKNFLDIGCAEGGFLVKAMQSGAQEVHGVEKNKSRERRAWDTLKAWDYFEKNSGVVDCVPPQHTGPWWDLADVTICFSMLHYVRHVFAFLDRIIELTGTTFFFEFSVQPETQNEKIEYRGPENEGVIMPWWILRDRMTKFGTVEVLSDPNKNSVGRRIIGCLTKG